MEDFWPDPLPRIVWMLQIFFSEYLDILCVLQTSHVKMATSASIIVISWTIVIVLVIEHIHHRQSTKDHQLDHHLTRASHLSDES